MCSPAETQPLLLYIYIKTEVKTQLTSWQPILLFFFFNLKGAFVFRDSLWLCSVCAQHAESPRFDPSYLQLKTKVGVKARKMSLAWNLGESSSYLYWHNNLGESLRFWGDIPDQCSDGMRQLCTCSVALSVMLGSIMKEGGQTWCCESLILSPFSTGTKSPSLS